MLKITPDGALSGVRTLRLEGRVTGPWIDELRRSVEHILGIGEAVRLDLSAVSFLDRDAVALFRALLGRGVKVINGSPFVAELLGDA